MKTKRIVSLLLTVLMACSVFAGLSVSAEDTTTHTYTAVGEGAFLNGDWDPANAANDLALQEDGTYVKTYSDVAAGVYQLKVAEDHAWENSFGATLEDNNNIKFEVPEKGATELKVILKLEGTKEIEVKEGDVVVGTKTVNNGFVTILVDGSPAQAPKPPVETFHVVAGAPELCNGVSWDAAAEANKMTLGEDGVYYIEYTDVAAGSYEFKITTNGGWDNGDWNLVGDAKFGGPNAVAEITADQAPATVRIEFKEDWGHGKLYINGVDVTPSQPESTETDPPIVVDPDLNITTGITYRAGYFTAPEGVETQRLFFEMPIDAKDKDGNVHNWKTFNNATGTCYWWDGEYACESWQYSYQMKPSGRANTYYIDAPKDATTVIFSNGIDGGEKGSDNPNWGKNYQTVNIGTEYYDPGESANYPEGLPSFNNMVYIPDVNNATENEFSGATTYGGEWYFLHEDGTADFENKGDVFVPTIVPIEATISKTAVTLAPKAKTTLSVEVKNGEPGYTTVWSSDDEKVATVDENGVVTAVAKGETNVKVTVAQPDNSTFAVVACKITVKQPVTSVKLNATKKTIYNGKTVTLKATVAPSNADNKAVTWKSSNTKIATVSSKGVVKGVKPGTAKVTATAKDGSKKYATCTITVKAQKATKLTISKKSAKLAKKGKYVKVKATLSPSNTYKKAIKVTTSNKKVAKISASKINSGKSVKITAVKRGTAKVKFTAADGSKKNATCKVTVKK